MLAAKPENREKGKKKTKKLSELSFTCLSSDWIELGWWVESAIATQCYSNGLKIQTIGHPLHHQYKPKKKKMKIYNYMRERGWGFFSQRKL